MEIGIITPQWALLGWTGLLIYLPLMLTSLFLLMRKDFRDTTDKLLWALGIVFLPIIGSILFLLIGWRRQ